MKYNHKNLILLNLAVIVFGILFLGWYYILDGKVFNRPIVFTNGVDPMALELDKTEYNIGDTPNILSSFCKTRPSSGSIEWTLVDGQKVQYSPTERREIAVGCYPETPKTRISSPVQKIPLYIENTCEAYFVGVGKVKISGDRTVEYTYRTEKFCIVGAELADIIK